MADAFESQMLDPNADLAPFIERFTEIVNHEWQILLAIDDFGLMELDKCRNLFEVIDGWDGRRFTIIISQVPIKSWFDLFMEHTYADACLARITDKRYSYRLEMNGISMREAKK